MNEKTIITIGKTLFWLSFILGSISLFGYALTKNDLLAEGGILVLEYGFVVNMIVLVTLLIYGIVHKSKLNACLKSSGIMLINIPIAIIYIIIGVQLVSINFLNP
ncbi:hypothetical protein [Chryseobacterium sp. C3]|uniref:hypothetical protein n=1 Tax=Chryseobacterium sp. C3 TaxID=2761532 RepID=UPI0016270780|nr:hypothetical protein [Chryseobacterium sp. C3]